MPKFVVRQEEGPAPLEGSATVTPNGDLCLLVNGHPIICILAESMKLRRVSDVPLSLGFPLDGQGRVEMDEEDYTNHRDADLAKLCRFDLEAEVKRLREENAKLEVDRDELKENVDLLSIGWREQQEIVNKAVGDRERSDIKLRACERERDELREAFLWAWDVMLFHLPDTTMPQEYKAIYQRLTAQVKEGE